MDSPPMHDWEPPLRPRRPRRGLAIGLVAAGTALVLVETEVVAGPARTWIWADRLFWHPVAVACLALAVVVTAFWIGFRSFLLAGLAITGTVVGSAPVLLLLVAFETPSSSAPVERFPSPDGRWTAVVDHESVHLLEDGSHIWIETHRGLRSRRWPAGCLDADDPDDGFRALTWNGPHQARIETEGGQVRTLHLDPVTGEPLARVNTGVMGYVCG